MWLIVISAALASPSTAQICQQQWTVLFELRSSLSGQLIHPVNRNNVANNLAGEIQEAINQRLSRSAGHSSFSTAVFLPFGLILRQVHADESLFFSHRKNQEQTLRWSTWDVSAFVDNRVSLLIDFEGFAVRNMLVRKHLADFVSHW